jgi:heptosyltransferase-1
MASRLQVYDPRERRLVALADFCLTLVAPLIGTLPPWRRAAPAPRRILLLRLERIGDLLMTAAAIERVRRHAPDASIDLIVGRWNTAIASLLRGVDRVETLDAPWLARDAEASTLTDLARQAWDWRTRGYDLAINFEPDIRSHALMALSGALVRVGFDAAGGGPLLTRRLDYRTDCHVSVNAARLVGAAFASDDTRLPAFRLNLPDDARSRAAATIPAGTPVVAVHGSGGRRIKQWPPERFASVATRLATDTGAVIALTGTPADRPIVSSIRSTLPERIKTLDFSGALELVDLAALFERCHLLVTGDTGPMHLAAAVGTPVVAVFGPSDPVRYAPRDTAHRVVRIDLPCAPCNRIRLPPARCQGHTPDCLEGVTVEAVTRAAIELLEERHGPTAGEPR